MLAKHHNHVHSAHFLSPSKSYEPQTLCRRDIKNRMCLYELIKKIRFFSLLLFGILSFRLVFLSCLPKSMTLLLLRAQRRIEIERSVFSSFIMHAFQWHGIVVYVTPAIDVLFGALLLPYLRYSADWGSTHISYNLSWCMMKSNRRCSSFRRLNTYQLSKFFKIIWKTDTNNNSIPFYLSHGPRGDDWTVQFNRKKNF